jgi:hypothetical protein
MTIYAARIRIPELVEREKANVTELKIYRDNGQIVPSAATLTILKPTGDKLVDAGLVAIDGSGSLTYTLAADLLSSSLNFGEGYVQEWAVTIDTVVYTFRRMMSVVRRRLYPVISDIDLVSTYSDLANIRPSALTSYQKYIDEAWYTILMRMRGEGAGYEYLILTPESLRASHLNLSLYYIFRDFHSSLGQSNGRYLDLAKEHFSVYETEYGRINFVYDEDNSGVASDPDKRTAKTPTIFLSGSPYYRYYRFGRS